MNISVLVGKTITEILGGKGDGELKFTCSDGTRYKMYHEQACCEDVSIDDICGDLGDLLNSPVTTARENTNTPTEGKGLGDSFAWTFYDIATQKGAVTIKWYGESNGYYSESVDFEQML